MGVGNARFILYLEVPSRGQRKVGGRKGSKAAANLMKKLRVLGRCRV